MEKYLYYKGLSNKKEEIKDEIVNNDDEIRKEIRDLKNIVSKLVKNQRCSKKSNKELITQEDIKGKTFTYTDTEMAKWLIKNHTQLKLNDLVLDACKGGGAFYDNLPSLVRKDWCEIDLGRDFLKYNKKVDVCLSSPPFVPRKLFWDFMVKAMDITRRNIYWLINMSSLNTFTPRRLEMMEEKKWFIQKLTVVLDKRWFGRYVWVQFGRENTGMFSYNTQAFSKK